ncbi:MAG: hypothetical protein ACOC2E_03595 [Bacteroidota bacterium]
MPLSKQQRKFLSLRKEYPQFIYESFRWEVKKNILSVVFHFHIGEEYHFYPTYKFPVRQKDIDHLDEEYFSNLIFHLGMVEMISYWKTTCSPVISIQPRRLREGQIDWWKKLFFNGLGEFFHVNGIQTTQDQLFDFEFLKAPRPFAKNKDVDFTNGFIVPVGGGKDSAVTLSLLNKLYDNNTAFVLNPGKAARRCIEIAGLENNVFEVSRTLDPLLLKMNKKGFLNGHTPFSALLAFLLLIVGSVTRKKNIALSNESSANEATIPGTMINHQYSKSFDFEQDFRWYVYNFMNREINYFSFLRPLNELQIARIFSSQPSYFSAFRSCNVGSKKDIWCCNCSKCLFTYIMLSPFVSREQLFHIFGEDLFERITLIPVMEQLTGFAPEKPFECVGTIAEVNAALTFILKQNTHDQLPVLLSHYKDLKKNSFSYDMNQLLKNWNTENALNDELRDALLKELNLKYKDVCR